DPRDNVIRLSQDVYSSTSIAAIGVACHEAGHAAQHAQGYVPIKIRNAILPICNIGSTLGFPLAIAGIIFSFEPLISIGLLLYALVAVFQFATLPVEFNASSRAIKVIDEAGILNDDEAKGAIKVLKSAAMTYVAALTVSIANLLRLFMLANNRRD
ncbi:MAG: zinc metallopeptidase, partial [Oscillospiraceae bacterium]